MQFHFFSSFGRKASEASNRDSHPHIKCSGGKNWVQYSHKPRFWQVGLVWIKRVVDKVIKVQVAQLRHPCAVGCPLFSIKPLNKYRNPGLYPGSGVVLFL
jgi:hypothetical protein